MNTLASQSKRERLRERRKEKGYTQEGLAKEVGVSKDQIKSLEYGRVDPSFKLMKRLCEVLDSTSEYLF